MIKYSGMRKRCSMTFKESNCIRPKYEEAGFTLSELLIVVAVIAVLVAISIPIRVNGNWLIEHLFVLSLLAVMSIISP